MKKRVARIALALILLCVLAYAMVLFSFQKIEKRNTKFKNSTEFWSHRGLVPNGAQENTIVAFEFAIENNVSGIELDVFWIDSLNELVLMHHYDSSFSLRPYTTFTKVLNRFQDSAKYWLDLKNLNRQNVENIEAHLKKKLAQEHNVPNVYVENDQPFLLNKLKDSGIKRLLWIQYNRTNWISKNLKKAYYKTLISLYDFEAYSCSLKLYDNDYSKTFGQLPNFLFHGTLSEYNKINTSKLNVPVALVDAEFYINR